MLEYTVRVFDNGGTFWYLNGLRHRENGPAAEFPNGHKAWYLNGLRHREDGPAIEWANGRKDWYWHGKQVTEEEHKLRAAPIIEMTVAEISKALGKKVKVIE